MVKVLLAYILFLIVVKTTWETKVKKVVKMGLHLKYYDKVMCNFSSQRVLVVVSDIVNIIIAIIIDKNLLIVIAYKLKILSDKVLCIANIALEFLKFMLIMVFKVFSGIFRGKNTLRNTTEIM